MPLPATLTRWIQQELPFPDSSRWCSWEMGKQEKPAYEMPLLAVPRALTGGEESRTIYLDLEKVEINAPEGFKDDPITLMVYDCGGQQDYAVGQAPFMTKSSLYILLVAADKACDENYEEVLQRFLVLLQARAPGAVVQLVLSKVDEVSDEDEVERKKKWLKDKVDEQLEEWRNAAADREAERSFSSSTACS